MRLVPVIDLLNGEVVHAVGGRRRDYRRLSTPLTPDPTFTPVANALLRAAASATLYVADLGRILGAGDATPLILDYLAAHAGVTIWLDAGLRTAADVAGFPRHPRLVPVLGTETLAGPEVAAAARGLFAEVVLSVDLQASALLGPWAAAVGDVAAVATLGTAASGASAVVLLDLASVGERAGPAALADAAAVRAALPPGVALGVGGGVRAADLPVLAAAGADFALVASMLHRHGGPERGT